MGAWHCSSNGFRVVSDDSKPGGEYAQFVMSTLNKTFHAQFYVQHTKSPVAVQRHTVIAVAYGILYFLHLHPLTWPQSVRGYLQHAEFSPWLYVAIRKDMVIIYDCGVERCCPRIETLVWTKTPGCQLWVHSEIDNRCILNEPIETSDTFCEAHSAHLCAMDEVRVDYAGGFLSNECI